MGEWRSQLTTMLTERHAAVLKSGIVATVSQPSKEHSSALKTEFQLKEEARLNKAIAENLAKVKING